MKNIDTQRIELLKQLHSLSNDKQLIQHYDSCTANRIQNVINKYKHIYNPNSSIDQKSTCKKRVNTFIDQFSDQKFDGFFENQTNPLKQIDKNKLNFQHNSKRSTQKIMKRKSKENNHSLASTHSKINLNHQVSLKKKTKLTHQNEKPIPKRQISYKLLQNKKRPIKIQQKFEQIELKRSISLKSCVNSLRKPLKNATHQKSRQKKPILLLSKTSQRSRSHLKSLKKQEIKNQNHQTKQFLLTQFYEDQQLCKQNQRLLNEFSGNDQNKLFQDNLGRQYNQRLQYHQVTQFHSIQDVILDIQLKKNQKSQQKYTLVDIVHQLKTRLNHQTKSYYHQLLKNQRLEVELIAIKRQISFKIDSNYELSNKANEIQKKVKKLQNLFNQNEQNNLKISTQIKQEQQYIQMYENVIKQMKTQLKQERNKKIQIKRSLQKSLKNVQSKNIKFQSTFQSTQQIKSNLSSVFQQWF